jgi:chemotaxis protein methyltransferase CheR
MMEIAQIKLDSKHVENFQRLLMDMSGLFIDERRIHDLERAVKGRMVSLGIFDYLEYYRLLARNNSKKKELDQLVLSLTVGETHFFRTPPQFEALRTCILPELIKKKESGHKRLRFLSAGCSTGEEAYSIVIMLLETFPELADWNIDIIAFDINLEFIEKAKSGVYPERKLRLVPPDIRRRYFKHKGKLFKLSDKIKKRVKFLHLNLTSPDLAMLGADEPFDVILCRNVLIYFEEQY